MQIPEIQLFTDRMKKKEVDLVIDVGNSATCALLFENKDDNSFDFESVKKLEKNGHTFVLGEVCSICNSQYVKGAITELITA